MYYYFTVSSVDFLYKIMKNDILQYANKATSGLVVCVARSHLVRLRPFGSGHCLIGAPGFDSRYYSQIICGLLSTSHDLDQGCVWGVSRPRDPSQQIPLPMCLPLFLRQNSFVYLCYCVLF